MRARSPARDRPPSFPMALYRYFSQPRRPCRQRRSDRVLRSPSTCGRPTEDWSATSPGSRAPPPQTSPVLVPATHGAVVPLFTHSKKKKKTKPGSTPRTSGEHAAILPVLDRGRASSGSPCPLSQPFPGGVCSPSRSTNAGCRRSLTAREGGERVDVDPSGPPSVAAVPLLFSAVGLPAHRFFFFRP